MRRLPFAWACVILSVTVAGCGSNAHTGSVAQPTTSSATTPSTGPSGFWSDGWVRQDAIATVPAGPAGVLRLEGEVAAPAQSLTVDLDGAVVYRAATPLGRLAVAIPVGQSGTQRQIALHWARTARVGPSDPRRAAAHLEPLKVATVAAPTAIKAADLGRAAAPASGVYQDGWMLRHARFLIRGGSAGVLEIAALVLAPGQALAAVVDGRTVFSAPVGPGPVDLRIPVAEGPAARLVELRWAKSRSISAADRRPAAALLRRVGVARTAVRRQVTAADVAAGRTATSGIYRDGWLQPNVRALLAGGAAGTLTFAASTLAGSQRLEVWVNGERLGSAPLPRGNDVVRVHVAASKAPRLVAFRFARAQRISPSDARRAAALLRYVTLGRAPTVAPTSTSHTSTSAAPSSTLGAALSSAQAVPAPVGAASSARGVFTASVTGDVMRWKLRVSGLTGPVVAAVVHTGAEGAVGARVVQLCAPCADDSSGTVSLDASSRASLEGAAYVNVGTAQNPGGEVRGQIRHR